MLFGAYRSPPERIGIACNATRRLLSRRDNILLVSDTSGKVLLIYVTHDLLEAAHSELDDLGHRAKPKRVAEVDRVPARVPVQVEPARQPDRVFLGALDRLEGPSYFTALQVG